MGWWTKREKRETVCDTPSVNTSAMTPDLSLNAEIHVLREQVATLTRRLSKVEHPELIRTLGNEVVEVILHDRDPYYFNHDRWEISIPRGGDWSTHFDKENLTKLRDRINEVLEPEV